MAAVLWGGGTAAVSGRAAAALWAFPDFDGGSVEISLRGGRRSRRGVVVRRVDIPKSDVITLRGIRVTTAARTVADLAGTTTDRRFDAAFHHVLHHRLATLEALADLADRYAGPGHPGAARLRSAVAAYNGRPAASPLEARLARRLRASALPKPVRQHEIRLGHVRYFLDFAWVRHRVAIEVDGYRWHSSRQAWQRDRERLTALRRAGWTVVNATKEDVDARFEALLAELRSLLG